MKLAVLLACYNRCELTIACLRRLFAQEIDSDSEIVVYLVDDGSSDGTSEQVKCEFPGVRIIAGDGSLYNYGALRLAMSMAKEDSFDAVVIMNDDVVLDSRAMLSALNWSKKLGPDSMVAGAMRDPQSGGVTYAGFARVAGRPLKTKRVLPDQTNAVEVDALNGNFVIIPSKIAHTLDNFAPYLTQKLGDIEFSYRAAKFGFKSFLLPGTFGECPNNPIPSSTVYGFKALRQVLAVKELPLSVVVPFCREHAGPLWFFWMWTIYIGPFCKGFGRRI